MGKMSKLIIAVVAVAVVAIAAYVFLFQGGSLIPTISETVTGSDSLTEIDSGAESAATDAETATSDIADEIGAADNLEVPGVDE